MLETVVCTKCGRKLPVDRPQTFCHTCNTPLYAQYDVEKINDTVSKKDLRTRAPNMWRYKELLPV